MESISQNQNQFWFLSTLPYNFENVFNMVTGCKLDISLLFSFLSSTGKTDVTLENSGKTVFRPGFEVSTKRGVRNQL